MRVRTFAEPDALAVAAAAAIAEWVREDVAERGRSVLAFSGGKSPAPLLAALAEADLAWETVHVFQVDERVAPDGHPDRNLNLFLGTLDRVVPVHQLHPMPVTADDLCAAAAEYADLLREVAGDPPVLDVVHLGLGADGHTASLVPGDKVLEVRDREVAISGPYEERLRMTLTYPPLNRARRLLWQVTGSDKRDAVEALLGAGEIPGARVRQDMAVLYVAADAAPRPA